MMRKMMKPMMRRGEPLTATPYAKLMRGESSSVAQNKKFSSVHSLRGGIIVGPGNLPSLLYVSCKASCTGHEEELVCTAPTDNASINDYYSYCGDF